jgi:hypothetical protein
MRRAITLAVAAVLLLAAPALALAAGTSSTPAPPPRIGDPVVKGKPVTPSGIDVQLWPEDVKGSMTLVVVAAVPTSTPFPAAVTIPLPQGATITWAGEIFGGGTNDVQRQPDVSKDQRTVTITAQKSRFVQYEARYKPYVVRNGRHLAELDWVQSAPAARMDFAFRLPALASDVHSAPKPVRDPDVNQSGDKLYTLPTQKLAVGKTFKFSVDYLGEMYDIGLQPKPAPDILMISLFSVLGLVVVALVVVIVRSRRSV